MLAFTTFKTIACYFERRYERVNENRFYWSGQYGAGYGKQSAFKV